MSEYDNTNSGAIFVNDKGDNEQRPDRKGSLNVEGVDYWISGWIREKNGKPYMSLKVERKEQQSNNKMHGSEPVRASPAPVADDEDDQIPF